jgi:hypothetical protein
MATTQGEDEQHKVITNNYKATTTMEGDNK